jgi:hypothetical protein
MSSIDELVSQIPIGDLAGRLGLSEDQTRAAVDQAVPALMSGMAANADDPAGAASLSDALGAHARDNHLLDDGVNLDQVDTADGEKIVHNVFGDNEDAVVRQLGGLGKLGGGTFAQLLPMLAPLVMAFLARSRAGSGGGATAAAKGSGDLGGMLGGLLGGGGGGGAGGLGDVLGGLLGGGKR